MNAGWTVIVHRHAHEIEVWDCAIVDRAYAEDAVRQQYLSQIVLVSANQPLTANHVSALGLQPGEIRKRDGLSRTLRLQLAS
jgi:hypothetical protein